MFFFCKYLYIIKHPVYNLDITLACRLFHKNHLYLNFHNFQFNSITFSLFVMTTEHLLYNHFVCLCIPNFVYSGIVYFATCRHPCLFISQLLFNFGRFMKLSVKPLFLYKVKPTKCHLI